MLKQLSGLDAVFLYMENANSFGHVSSLSVYETPNPGYKPYEAFLDQIQARLSDLEPFRRRLVAVPFDLDHPYWINDPNFDLDFHVRHIALPAPGNSEQLGLQVSRIIGRPMDRAHPLWETYVFEGLENGDFAILTKVHHSTIDGAAGVELLTMLLDAHPDAPAYHPATHDWVADAVPSDLEILGRTLSNFVRQPARLVRFQTRMVRDFAAMTRSNGLGQVAGAVQGLARILVPSRSRGAERDAAPDAPSRSAPATPFNKSITAHRRFAFRSVPLDDIKTIKLALGCTVNDVVMAVCAGALRRYLLAHDALPGDPLISMVPVSIRTGDEADKWSNRVSGLFCALPTNEADPRERITKVHQSMMDAKGQFDLIPAEMIVEIAQMAPPALATRAMRMASRLRISDRMNPPVNLVISNVPGPRAALYLAGAKLKHYYPVSTVTDGQGLNITVQSYLDTLDFGLVSCRELVPDLWDLVDYCVDEVNALVALVSPQKPKAAKATSGTAESKKKSTPRKAIR